MIKKLCILLVLVCSCAFAYDANDLRYSITYGYHMDYFQHKEGSKTDDVSMIELGVEYDSGFNLYKADVLYELSIVALYNDIQTEHIENISLGFKFDIWEELYFKYSFGLAYLSDTDAFDEEFGTHLQFKNQFRLGYNVSEDIAIEGGLLHYSQGGILGPSNKNDGLDIVHISVIFRF